MNLTDFLIIYLACGAPFGVYFFLQNRKKFPALRLWMKFFLTVFVWFPYAFLLLHDFITKKSTAGKSLKKSAVAERLVEIQKSILEQQSGAPVKISPFEVREVLERYAELTLSCRTDGDDPTASEKEVYRVALRQNLDIGAECLHRRNRQKLLFHQTLAREDFLKIIVRLKNSISDPEMLEKLTAELTGILKDPEAQEAVAAVFDEKQQSGDQYAVRKVENVVWNSTEHKPSVKIQSTPFHSRPLTKATAAAPAAGRTGLNKGKD